MPLLKPILPVKKKRKDVSDLKNRGWNEKSFSELQGWADNLLEEQTPPETADKNRDGSHENNQTPIGIDSIGIDSIPNVWARPLVFFDQLKGAAKGSPALGAYRGLLAFLAMSKRLGSDIRIEPVDLTKPLKESLACVVLRKLAPTRSALPAAPSSPTGAGSSPWLNLYLFELGGRVIGMTSPLTIVFPASGGQLHEQLPSWWDSKQGCFIDPIESLEAEDRADVAAWIEKLNKGLGAAGSSDSGRTDLIALQNILTNFSKELRSDAASNRPTEPEMVKLKGLGSPYDELIGSVLGPRKGSDVLLAADAPLTLERPNVYLLSEETASQWKKKPSEIKIFDGLTLEYLKNALRGLAKDQELRDQAPGSSDRKQYWVRHGLELADKNQIWIEEDFFTPKLGLLRSKPPGAFDAGRSLQGQDGNPVYAIFPIRPNLLRHLKPQSVLTAISFDQERSNPKGIGVVLKIPVASERAAKALSSQSDAEPPLDGAVGQAMDQTAEVRKERELVVRRFYEWRETVAFDSPVLEVWPDFKASNWARYFVLWDTAGQPASVFRCVPRAAGEAGAAKTDGPFEESAERKIWRLTNVPEYFSCSSAAGEQVGVLLVKYKEYFDPSRKDAEASWTVGVDFGTSSTQLYYKPKDGKPTVLPFETGSLAVTETALRLPTIYRRFIPPPPGLVSPFLSFFRRRPGQGATGTDLEAVRDGHIFFFAERLNQEQLLGEGGGPGSNVRTNLKWGEGEEQTCALAFVKQVMLQAAAEAFRKGASVPEWRYAVPTAFTQIDDDRIKGYWKNAATWLATAPISLDADPKQYTETAAAAAFFKSLPAHLNEFKAVLGHGAIFIDIGGGTSDISIWQDNEIFYHASVRLAGQDILLRPLFRLRHTLREFLPKDLKDHVGIGEQGLFVAFLEAYLRGHGDELRSQLEKNRSAARKLLQTLALGLCGLFYYTGVLLKHSIEKIEKPKPYDRNNIPDVRVAGSGSKLLDWLSICFSRDASEDVLFRRMMLHAAGINPDRNGHLKISPLQKHEVAWGLVADDIKDLKLDRRKELGHGTDGQHEYDRIVSGEEFEARPVGASNGAKYEKYAATDLIDQMQLSKGAVRLGREASCKELRRFSSAYNNCATDPKFWRELQAIPEAAVQYAERKVQQDLVDISTNLLTSKEPRAVRLEPLFITGLRALLDVAFFP